MKPRSRTKRWMAAAEAAESALSDLRGPIEELEGIKEEYQEWLDNLPENLQQSELGNKLDQVTGIDISIDYLDEIDNAIQEALNCDLPLGFGRD